MVRVWKHRRGEHDHHAGDNRGLPCAPSSRTGGVPTTLSALHQALPGLLVVGGDGR